MVSLPHLEDFDVERVHVHEPINVVLLCGGQYKQNNDGPPLSLRDAFLNAVPPPSIMKEYELIQAEEITQQFNFSNFYDDILKFETDIAQIVHLIILFCESQGALTELGAFSVIDEIMNRLFVIIDENYWSHDSFIKLGPLRRIVNKVGRHAIHVISDEDFGKNGKSLAQVNKSELVRVVENSLKVRLEVKSSPRTFNKNYAGHIIKLIVGLTQEYGALTEREIIHALKFFGVEKEEKEIKGYLLCACAVNWIFIVSKGIEDYYLPTNEVSESGKDAAVFSMKSDSKEKNKMRRRVMIRDCWKSQDEVRYSALRKSNNGV
ncbi:retron St85 family effector protein [Niveispirillum sp. BGYR6]|uniref:retron St85 family effector protein n=1 Tax=Niveispirillum sp. BGYR6 TaxID=2971249 RepID=UPI0022B94C45|nr:retron St85 family effector protein [Niveispirillum sp. BGYR6]MDG5495139.1 retron St85 family effector protein [Niveispirillum sp. BGYR6]